jgi:HlyD family secretion protein
MLERAKTLWANRPSWMRGRLAMIGGGAVLLVVLFMLFGPKKQEEPYRTAQIDRGSITRVVSATGTLQPLVSANVGSTVSGPVQSVEVDFNSQVRAGQVLARLDPAPFQQRVQQAQASLASARAQAAVSDADYQRYARLEQAGFASPQLIAQQRAARDQARASVSQAAAQLASARTDLERSVIRSPITGVVVDKQVSVGQSVAASFQAATLFVIAQDLARLQANITVDEADIGEVSQGQSVRFTVDAFPDREFEGRVSQVRQQGASESGVVSYTVVVEADNPGRRLLPGMTANADIIIEQQNDVLRVANTALRFRPADPEIAAQGQAIASEPSRSAPNSAGGGRGLEQMTQALELTPAQQATAREAFSSALQSVQGGGDRRAAFGRAREQAFRALEPSLSARQRELLTQLRAGGGEQARTRQAVVWVLRDRRPAPVQIEIGIADSAYTQLAGGDVREGDEVIIGGGPQAPVNLQQLQRNAPGGGGGPGGMRIRGG